MLTRGLINRSRPLMLQQAIGEAARIELLKGGHCPVSPVPVALEPPFTPIRSARAVTEGSNGQQVPWIEEPAPALADLHRLQIHLSPEQDTRWEIAEAFPRQLRGVLHRVGFEVAGNQQGIGLWLLCQHEDVGVVRTAFEGTFDRSRLQQVTHAPWMNRSTSLWHQAQASEFLAPAAYSKRLTEPEEIPVTPLASVLRALQEIPSSAFGVYQVLFQPVSPKHNWHRNIGTLHDYEFLFRLSDGSHPALRSYQQLPTGDEKHLTESLNTKADNDRAIVAVALRLVVLGDTKDSSALRSLEVFSGLLQHGGKALTPTRIGLPPASGPDQLRDAMERGLTYRPGFLANARELTALVNLPPPTLIQRAQRSVSFLETLPPSPEIQSGCLLGTCDYAGERLSVCIPLADRMLSTHTIGGSGMGKSVFLLNQCLDDIERGDGVAVLDAHGDLIQALLERIPERHVDRVILLDWSDPSWIPLFNPFFGIDPDYRGRVADDFVAAMESFIKDWGHRLSYLLRSTIHGLLHLPRISLLDVADTLSPKSPEGILLRNQVLERIDDPQLIRFWRFALGRYTPSELSPPQNKLSMMLSTPPVSFTFQQTESAINLRQIMERQEVLLINLSNVGSETQSIIGCLMLSLFQMEAMARGQKAAADRKRFFIHVDEAAQFVTRALQSMLVQTRKFQVGLILAHQYFTQFYEDQVDALSTVGNTVIFRTNRRDAEHLCKDLQDKVKPEDIIGLKRYQAIARIGTEVVRFQCRPPRPALSPSFKDRIVARSRQLYYKTAEEVRQAIARRHERWVSHSPPAAASGNAGATNTEFAYDIFHTHTPASQAGRDIHDGHAGKG